MENKHQPTGYFVIAVLIRGLWLICTTLGNDLLSESHYLQFMKDVACINLVDGSLNDVTSLRRWNEENHAGIQSLIDVLKTKLAFEYLSQHPHTSAPWGSPGPAGPGRTPRVLRPPSGSRWPLLPPAETARSHPGHPCPAQTAAALTWRDAFNGDLTEKEMSLIKCAPPARTVSRWTTPLLCEGEGGGHYLTLSELSGSAQSLTPVSKITCK